MREWHQHECAQVAKGASRAARALLRAGADPARPVRGATPREDALTLAAGAGRAELASALISAGAPPSGEAALLAEVVAEIGQVRFIDDSKATNVGAAARALEAAWGNRGIASTGRVRNGFS